MPTLIRYEKTCTSASLHQTTSMYVIILTGKLYIVSLQVHRCFRGDNPGVDHVSIYPVATYYKTLRL